MPVQYDFQNISFDDFERLCADLLHVREGINFEAFKVGRDQGIDLRYSSSVDGTVIVQCKRYAPNAFARLKRDLGTKELPKVAALAPDRYILCTSCKLSPNQKDQLFALLKPHCLAAGDILGADELNVLLAANDAIERRHFKLWLGSTAILQRVLHAGVFAYGEHEMDSLQREISRYVVHDGFHRALSLLDETHHCIIVGIPGVGKTIAARLLIAHYIRDGFDVVSVTHDIDDAWKVLDRPSDAKVVIYYDDFLGQMTFSQKLGKNEDRRLLELVAHCKKSKNKRFILTTRDYIFDQALAAYEPLGRAKDVLERSRVKLDDYGLVVRARLLANHLQFSNVGAEILQEIVRTRAYNQIIRHQNFLPRMIEQLCSDKEVRGKSPEQFIQNAMAVLDDPSQVWKRPFGQLSQEARYLAYSLASLNGDAESRRLEDAWCSLCEDLGLMVERDFAEVLREVEGSFTHSQMYPGLGKKAPATFVKFINPSVREFVLTDLISKSSLFRAVILSAVAFTQLLFWTQARSSFVGKTPEQLAAKVADDIAERATQLLSVGEPEVSRWADGVRVRWTPGPKKILRLNTLFTAFDGFKRADLTRSVVSSVLDESLATFLSLMAPDDLMWAPEVLRTMVGAKKTDDPDSLRNACETLKVDEWGHLANDFPDIGYLWDAAGVVIDLSADARGWDERVRKALAFRAGELFDAIPPEWTADEIAQCGDELELLAAKLDVVFDSELRRLRRRAQEKEIAASGGDEEINLAPDYRVRRVLDAEGDVDGIFQNLVDQLETGGGE
jgi:hypothetical protein